MNKSRKQSRVSMVIPCYNKEKYIRGMFDSILAQRWDNIELILINDGSTDGTRGIITEYKQKFQARGYEVIIVDQENQGVSAAVRIGLINITGEYVCQIDADDELDPRYISAMAGGLEENPDYEWAVCDSLRMSENQTAYIRTFSDEESFDCLIEKWLFWKMILPPWLYMVRTKYLVQCKIIESFHTDRECNQESQFLFPLVAGNGKLLYLREPLYRHNYRDKMTHRSYCYDFISAKKRFYSLKNAFCVSINCLPLNNFEKKKLCAMAALANHLKLVLASSRLGDAQNLPTAVDELLEQVNQSFTLDAEINREAIITYPRLFSTAVRDNILGTQAKESCNKEGKIIAWGALGTIARAVLPVLKGTPLEPDELWDEAGDGVIIRKPDPARLHEDDLILILPMYAGDIEDAVKNSPCKNWMDSDDVLTYLAGLKFPEFYDDRASFVYNA